MGTSSIPAVSLSYNVGDVSTGITNWFSALWLIVAFACAIPLAFLIANKVKELFMH